MKDITERAIRGGFAKVCSQGVSFGVRIVSLMVLGRLLDPKDFGLVGMVTAAIGVLNLFRDFGLSTASVQRETVTNEQTSTLFWINLAVGAALALVAIAIAPFIVTFYQEPRLFWITVALAVGFIFNAAGIQHLALLQRQMRFTASAVIDAVSQLVSTAVGIAMAVTGYGPWSLVGMTIVAPIVSTICAWVYVGWVPGMPRRQVGIRSMMRFGGTITLNGLVVYVAYNLEKVLLGRFWGADAVGIYGRAYQLVSIPTENFNSAVGGVAFSSLARLQNDPGRLRTYFLKGYSLVLAVTIPITIACAVFAEDMILVLLGPKWKEAAAIFRLLAPTILVFAMINPLVWLIFALGQVGKSLKVSFVLAPLVIGAYVLALPYGPKGVAFGYSVAMTLWVLPHIAWFVHGTVISFRDVLKTASRPLLSGAVAAVLAVGAQALYGDHFSPIIRLLIGGGVILGAYMGMLLYVMGQRTFYLELIARVMKVSPEKKEAIA